MEEGYTRDSARVHLAAPPAAVLWCEEPQMAASRPRASNFAPHTIPMSEAGSSQRSQHTAGYKPLPSSCPAPDFLNASQGRRAHIVLSSTAVLYTASRCTWSKSRWRQQGACVGQAAINSRRGPKRWARMGSNSRSVRPEGLVPGKIPTRPSKWTRKTVCGVRPAGLRPAGLEEEKKQTTRRKEQSGRSLQAPGS